MGGRALGPNAGPITGPCIGLAGIDRCECILHRSIANLRVDGAAKDFSPKGHSRLWVIPYVEDGPTPPALRRISRVAKAIPRNRISKFRGAKL